MNVHYLVFWKLLTFCFRFTLIPMFCIPIDSRLAVRWTHGRYVQHHVITKATLGLILQRT